MLTMGHLKRGLALPLWGSNLGIEYMGEYFWLRDKVATQTLVCGGSGRRAEDGHYGTGIYNLRDTSFISLSQDIQRSFSRALSSAPY